MIQETPIPGSFLRGIVTMDYVTISSPSTKVVMLTKDARALMCWLQDVLPSIEAFKHVFSSDSGLLRALSNYDTNRARIASYSDLWIRRRMSA